MALPADRTLLIHEGMEFRVGTPMSREQLDTLPIGATVWNGPYDRPANQQWYTKRDNGRWSINTEETEVGYAQLANDFNHFRSLPDVEPEAAPPNETVANYKRRFAQWIPQRAAMRSEAHHRATKRALRTLGLETRLGDVVNATDVLPVGTQVTVGHPHEEGFTVFESRGRAGWVCLAGGAPLRDGIVIYEPDSPFMEVQGDQPTLIHEFAHEIWKVGHRISVRHNWCSEYERILEEFGIFGTDFPPVFEDYPDLTDQDKINLPVGSMMARLGGDGRWALKTMTPRGRGGTAWLTIAGTRVGGSETVGLKLIRTGYEQVLVKPLMWHLPDGAQVQYENHPDYRFIRDGGEWVRSDTGTRLAPSRFKSDIRLVSLAQDPVGFRVEASAQPF